MALIVIQVPAKQTAISLTLHSLEGASPTQLPLVGCAGSQSKREKNIRGILSGLDQYLSCTIDVHLYFTSQNLMLPKIGKEIFHILIRPNPALM